MEGVGCDRPNRLARTRSPYLRMHACDPVDWRSWDDVEPLLGKLDKPLFISIGYSTCHWCHVMHRESFMNPEVAAAINRAFIPVKVDREERPDVDEYYMAYCMVASRSCGWPLNVVAMPDGRPFFVATYMRPGDLIELAKAVEEAWRRDRGSLDSVARRAAEVLERISSPREAPLGSEVLEAAYRELEDLYDPLHGGFGEAPKFPEAPKHLYLMLRYARTGSERPLSMVLYTVRRMVAGGVYDKVWGGLHRYSVDREWRLPHFEKMLYDQAGMARILGELGRAGRLTEDLRWAAGKLIDFIRGFMLGPSGGLYSALDAESGGVEGGFYTWTMSELEEALDPEDLSLARKLFSLSKEGNYMEEASGLPSRRNILHCPATLEDMAKALGMGLGELLEAIDRISSSLRRYAAETGRPRPGVDDKVLASWNGLAVWGLSSLAVAGVPGALELAEGAAGFIRSRLMDGDRVLRSWREGEAYIEGMLDDYAHTALGLMALHEATGREELLLDAYELAVAIASRFQDSGGLLRLKPGGPVELQDGAYPSGYSAALEVLVKMGRLTGDRRLLDAWERGLRAISAWIAEAPTRYIHTLHSLDFKLNPSYEVVIATPGGVELGLLRALESRAYSPFKIVAWTGGPGGPLSRVAPHLRQMVPVEGRATIYVCVEGACSLPTSDPEKAALMLRGRLAGG